MWLCKHCKKEYDFNSASIKANHSRWCKENPDRNTKNMGKSSATISIMNESRKLSGYHNQYAKAKLLGLPKPIVIRKPNGNIKPRAKMSDESRAKVSAARKLWLRNNPDKHPWKNRKNNISVPCEKIKQFLTELQIDFVPEYSPNINERHFSIDIAMPDKKIALEVNGNQHYERNGSLKPYYQEREDILKLNGWQVYQIHYSACFNLEKLQEFFNKLKSSPIQFEFDYFNYVPKPAKNICTNCNGQKWITSEYCRKCFNKLKRNQVPSQVTKEELQALVWKMSMRQIALIYKVSDTCIKKWTKKYEIEIPPIGYFLRKEMVAMTGFEPVKLEF